MVKEGHIRQLFCPLCGAESFFVFNSKKYEIFDCGDCGHRFFPIDAHGPDHVEDVFSDDYFSGGGAGYSDYSAEASILRERGRMYARKISEHLPEPGLVLDVGAADGSILSGFQDAGWRGIGLEPNKRMVAIGTERNGLDLRFGTLEDFESKVRFDLLSVIQVAGHLYDPGKAFDNAFNLLSESGLLLIETWDRESRFARWCGSHWQEYSPPSVTQWFSKDGLDGFLRGIGFEKINGGHPSKKITGDHARSLLKYHIGDSFLLKLIPKKISFPYPSEDLIWGLYRKTSR
jgi:SAM-dependent methyltransferase